MSKPVCKIVGFDEFGPLLEWSEHWSKFPVGTALAQRPALVALTDEQLDAIYKRCVPAGTQTDKARQHARAAIAEFCRVNGITLNEVKDTAPVNAVNSPKAQEKQP